MPAPLPSSPTCRCRCCERTSRAIPPVDFQPGPCACIPCDPADSLLMTTRTSCNNTIILLCYTGEREMGDCTRLQTKGA